MSLESMLSALSHRDKLVAMELLWRDLSSEPSRYESPDWHERILKDRLAKPVTEDSLPLNEAIADVKERLDARRTQS